MYLLSKEMVFPPVHLANEDGILAIGGDLSTESVCLQTNLDFSIESI